jgi:hypothetical protein
MSQLLVVYYSLKVVQVHHNLAHQVLHICLQTEMITFAPINESKPLEIVASNLAEAHSFPVSYACIGDEVHSGDNEILVR